MDIQLIKTDDLTKVVLEGRLDTASVDIVELKFTAGIVAPGKPAIIDMSNVTFLGSMGIRMLLSAAKGLLGRGASLALFGATPSILETMETALLTDIIPVFGNEDAAISAVTA
jgi:anti-anti-sigma factor